MRWRQMDVMADRLFPKIGRPLQALTRHGFVCLRNGSGCSSKARGRHLGTIMMS